MAMEARTAVWTVGVEEGVNAGLSWAIYEKLMCRMVCLNGVVGRGFLVRKNARLVLGRFKRCPTVFCAGYAGFVLLLLLLLRALLY